MSTAPSAEALRLAFSSALVFHLGGQHDQKTHGRGGFESIEALGFRRLEEASREVNPRVLKRLQNLPPAEREEILAVLSGGGTYMVKDYDGFQMRVRTDLVGPSPQLDHTVRILDGLAQKHPPSEAKVVDVAFTDLGKGMLGMTSISGKMILDDSMLSSDTGGWAFNDQKLTFSGGAQSRTRVTSREYIANHEWGHLVSDGGANGRVQAIATRTYSRQTPYGKTSAEESFAEAFALSRLGRDPYWKSFDPEGAW